MSGLAAYQALASREREALKAIRALRGRLNEALRAQSEPIAIVGLSCRFPGSVTDAAGYWNLLSNGIDGVCPIPPERLDLGSMFDARRDVPGKTYSRWAGLVDEVDGFDAEFFDISSREAAQTDPQQRLFLEGSWLALEHAGISPRSLVGTDTGVFVGVTTTEYARLHDRIVAAEDIGSYFIQGLSANTVAGRVSYTLGLQGPALSIDTACSSSLVAIDRACRSLREGETRLAIAGGVNVLVTPEGLIAGSQLGMFSSDGRCKSFSALADGFVRGEGCGVVVLKRLRDASAAGDRVLAVIRGSAVNHDGPSSGLTVPSGLAQQALMRRALKAAGVSPAEVGYVEAHGTGTSLGDPIEAEALGAVMGEGRPVDTPLLIGSVKTNIGHLEAAAGVAGLIKVVLALGHGELPGQLHSNPPSPHIRWDVLKLRVVDRLRRWEPINGRRIAGVSSFGFSGTNAHLVVESAPAAADLAEPERPVEILPISAQSESALRVLAERYLERLQPPSVDWPDLCHTAAVGRAQFAHRLSVRGADAPAARAALEAFLAGQPHPALIKGGAKPSGRPRVGFLFTGQGSQYPGMGRALHAHSPGFRRIMERAEAVLAERLDVPLGAVMRGEHPQAAELLNQTLYTQPALYVLEYALAELWQGLGVQPAAVLGHSLGEYVGCAFANVFGFEDGLRLVADRARLMQDLVSDGAMLVVAASEAEVGGLLAGREAEVSLAGVNAARQVTISGARRAIEAIAAACAARGWRSHALPVSQAFHSPLMEPIGAAFEARAGEIAYAAPRLPVISNLTGTPLETASAAYWRAHMRQAVRFSQGLEALSGLGCDVLIEVGPRPVLIQLARQAASSAQTTSTKGTEPPPRRYLTSLKGPDTDEWDTLCAAVQELHAAGAELDWAGWNRDYRRRKVDAPSYPFERRRHWISPSANKPEPPRGRARGPGHPLLGTRLRSALAGGQFEADLAATGETAWLADHRIAGQAIMPATGLIEIMLAAGQAIDSRWGCLEGLSILAPLCLSPGGTRTVQTIVDGAQDGRARVRVFAAAADAAGSEAPPDAQGQLRFHLHAEASLAPATALAGEGPDLAALRSRCTRRIAGEAHYRHLAARGADFGPAFRGVRQLWAGEGEAIGDIEVSLPSLSGDRPHPAVLDACLQVAAAVLADSADTYMPVKLDHFDCLTEPWPEHLTVHACLARPDPLSPVFDFTVCDPDGKTRAHINNLRFQNTNASTNTNLQAWLYELVWRPMLAAENTAEGPADWIVIGSGGMANKIATFLRAAAKTVTGSDGTGLENAFAGRDERLGIVYVPPELEGDVSEPGPMSARPGVEQLLALSRHQSERAFPRDSRLYVVTRKVHAVLSREGTVLTDAAICGLAATLMNEFPALRCTRIDIDPTDSTQAARDVALEALAGAAEDWVAYRNGRRFVARLQRAQDVRVSSTEEQGPVSLVSENGLDGLRWRSMRRRELESNEVEIEVYAAPLNFHDVVSVVGLIADQSPLGSECAGMVTRVGKAVKRFRRGDAVVAITPGSFATFAIAPENRVISKPPTFSFETASAQGLVYLTADHCLREIAKIRPGERVLIHAAAGGVGLAAVQLCQRAGAEIYATAGSDTKRAYLQEIGIKHVFSSRSLEFAAHIRHLTAGKGVDIVLNSLAGEFVDAGLSLLAPSGRFIEIGKTDIRDKATLRPGVVYEAVDLTVLLRDRPAATLERLSALFGEMAAGQLLPVPHQSHDFTAAKAVFRDLASARHIGKLVLAPAAVRTVVRADGVYIVTGGAASIGFAAAEWLAEQGAARVILFGRRPPAPDIAARLARWRERGVDMVAVQGDAGALNDVAAVVAQAGAALRGVIHCANVLDDAPLGELSWNRFETVMHPKAQGAWHLHHATAGCTLDFFVLFSSWASIAGTRGGANYAAANIALDSLAHLRWHQGQPALSLNWGAWADIGSAARYTDVKPARQGFGAMRPDQALAAMGSAIRHARSPQLAIASIDWFRLITTFGRGLASVFSDFVEPHQADVGRAPLSTARSLAEAIAGSSPAVMHSAVVSQLQILAAAALGSEDPRQIDPSQPLQDMGLDSIMAVDLRNTLAHSSGGALPSTLLFDHPTLNNLADYLIGLIAPTPSKTFPEHIQEDSDDLLALIEGLSDDEVDARLVSKGAAIAAS
jgi:acyl transferase domain-containing protein/aryl carrier-like protein